MPWITVEAPSYESYSEGFVITASKEGYISDERFLELYKGTLFITTDRGTVEEREGFEVTVENQDYNPVSGVEVRIDGNQGDSSITDDRGKAYFTAPEVNENSNVQIVAIKVGYISATTTIRIENQVQTSIVDTLITTLIEYLPIILAGLAVIFAVLFVYFRNKPSKLKPIVTVKEDAEISVETPKTTLPKSTSNAESVKQSELQSVTKDKGPWVEEIRIHDPDKKKETSYLKEKPEEKPKKAIIPRQRKGDYEWFEGEDYAKYKIDELTGELDMEKSDKWFEGERDIRSKVDKTLEKKHKKKKTK